MEFFQITCLKESKSMAAENKIFNIEWNKYHLSKAVVLITYTLEKIFFVVATFKGLWVLVWSVQVFFDFQRRGDQINTVCKNLIHFPICR